MNPQLASVRPDFATTPEQDLVGPLDLDDAISIPASINRFLRPYQREGARFLFEKYKANTGGVLGDDMGSVQMLYVQRLLTSAVLAKPSRS